MHHMNRFDREIAIGIPNAAARQRILQVMRERQSRESRERREKIEQRKRERREAQCSCASQRILQVMSSKIRLSGDIDFEKIANTTPGDQQQRQHK